MNDTSMKSVYLLLLPALVYGEISVYLDFKQDPNIIDVRGTVTHKISDSERKSFQLDDAKLRQAVLNYTKNEPTEVFITKDQSNLFEHYGWFDVNVTVKPIINVTEARNCSDAIEFEESSTVEVTSERKGNSLDVKEKTRFNIVSHAASFVFESAWGHVKQSQQQNWTAPYPAKMRKCHVTIELKYRAKLAGDVVVNFINKRLDHHYWAFDIVEMQNDGHFNKTVEDTELITITYYANSANVTTFFETF